MYVQQNRHIAVFEQASLKLQRHLDKTCNVRILSHFNSFIPFFNLFQKYMTHEYFLMERFFSSLNVYYEKICEFKSLKFAYRKLSTHRESFISKASLRSGLWMTPPNSLSPRERGKNCLAAQILSRQAFPLSFYLNLTCGAVIKYFSEMDFGCFFSIDSNF